MKVELIISILAIIITLIIGIAQIILGKRQVKLAEDQKSLNIRIDKMETNNNNVIGINGNTLSDGSSIDNNNL